jgi:hypothetical protein
MRSRALYGRLARTAVLDQAFIGDQIGKEIGAVRRSALTQFGTIRALLTAAIAASSCSSFPLLVHIDARLTRPSGPSNTITWIRVNVTPSAAFRGVLSESCRFARWNTPASRFGTSQLDCPADGASGHVEGMPTAVSTTVCKNPSPGPKKFAVVTAPSGSVYVFSEDGGPLQCNDSAEIRS